MGTMSTIRRYAAPAAAALCLAMAVPVLVQGFAASPLIAFIQGVVIFGGLIFLIGSALFAAGIRAAGWQEPATEAEFERIVQRSERLAQSGTAADPDEMEFLELDPYSDEDFEQLVADAMDELPDLLQEALRRNVAVVISDGGRKAGAYGLYHGDGVARDDIPDRIVIYRDTLRRDFGHDADLLRDEVTRTVRHELAHHLGADELGVRDLGL